MRVDIYERTPKITNYNASASGASGVSNEMQEVRARVVHRCGARLRESMMKVEWAYREREEEEEEEERKREEKRGKRECERELEHREEKRIKVKRK